MGEDLARPDDFQREEGRGRGGDTVALTRCGEGGCRDALWSGDVAGTHGEVVGKGGGTPSVLWTRGIGCSWEPSAPFPSVTGSGAAWVD